MMIIRAAAELERQVTHARQNGHSIGLVPTMGALHAGHLSLVERAVKENGVTVVSVFVNPTQFNNPTDLATYPRDEEADIRLLAGAGVDMVFMPTVEEIYPWWPERRERREFDLGGVAEVMEGRYRPGHFQGVAEVVSRLFALVRPDRAYFGEKDFQQIAVIRRMASLEGFDIDIVSCPIKREDDGLALSSRNTRLTPQQRAIAPAIHRILTESLGWAKSMTVDEVKKRVTEEIDAVDGLRTEYYEIVDHLTMQPVSDWSATELPVGCITVYCGDVRLIDNIKYTNR